jgi:hypothetical protein
MIKKNEEILSNPKLQDEARGFKPPEKKKTKLSESKKKVKDDWSIENSLRHMGAPLLEAAKFEAVFDGAPYYEHPNFDWRVKKLWQNDPKAVQYWIKNIKNKK